MKNSLLMKISLVCSLYLLMAGCCINIGCCGRVKSERIVRLSAALPPESVFAAQTHNGSITVNGDDVTDCNLTATIIARAATEEEAKKLAEEIKIRLEPSGNRLTARIEKPASMTNRSVSISLDVKVPNNTSLELTTRNGALRIANITGQVDGTTYNGSAAAERVCGTVKLRTHNGKVFCKEASGDINLRTHNGGVKAVYSNTAPPVCNISIVTHNGSIDFTAPPNLSAKVDVSTHNGSVHTNLPIMVVGKLSERKLTGTIGTAEGKLHLETHNGSVKIK